MWRRPAVVDGKQRMYWSESDSDGPAANDACMVDIVFRLVARELPADHAPELREVITVHLPWFGHDPATGLHHIQVAPSANGWLRPDASDGEMMQLSKRTRLVLRVSLEQVADCAALVGKVLMIAGCRLEVGASKKRPLRPSPTLFCRHVAINAIDEDEGQFLASVVAELKDLQIRPRKLLPGLSANLRTEQGPLATKSLLVAELNARDSLSLQCAGVGHSRALGCGLFTPHKDIGPVRSGDDPETTD